MPEKNKPISNPKLIEAINLMKKNDIPLTRGEMLTQLVSATFLTPALLEPVNSQDAENMQNGNPVNSKVRFNIIQSKDGSRYLMAFTDEVELNKWKQVQKNLNPETKNIALRFDDFANVILKAQSDFAGFVVDPFGVNLVFPTESIVSMDRQKRAVQAAVTHQQILNNQGNPNAMPQTITKHEIKDGTRVTLGEPKEYPQELADAIAAHLKTEKYVSIAYLQLMTQDTGRQSYLLVVDVKDKNNMRPLFEAIGNAARPHLSKLNLDIVPLDSQLGKTVQENAKPFYEKKKIINFFKK